MTSGSNSTQPCWVLRNHLLYVPSEMQATTQLPYFPGWQTLPTTSQGKQMFALPQLLLLWLTH